MSRHGVPHDLQYQFERGSGPENCKCGHSHSMHRPTLLVTGESVLRCGGHHVSGGISGMVQQCGCPVYQPYTEWVAERGWALCDGVNRCSAVVFDGGTLCPSCQSIADDCARDAHLETLS